MNQMHSTAIRWQPHWAQWPIGPIRHSTLYWAVFCVSITAFLLDFMLASRLPQLQPFLHIVGLVPCGFAWLLARSLFRPADKNEIWPQMLVATLFVICLVLYLDQTDASGGLMGYLGKLQVLLGSAVLLLTFVEPFDAQFTSNKSSSGKERRFRFMFAGGQAALVGTAFVFDLPEHLGGQDAAHATLATIALVAATCAWRYRLRNPLPGKKQATAKASRNPALAASIVTALEDEKLFLDPDIKVAGLAQRLNQPDYKISQCIVNDLGFPNFNQLVNEYRLQVATGRLSQSRYADVAILVIALDCGFGSIGPFNRAFKAKTGLTPSAYRNAALQRIKTISTR